jgi:hypothetical protein
MFSPGQAGRNEIQPRLRDSDGDTVTVTGKRRLVTRLTLKDGRVLYERPAV